MRRAKCYRIRDGKFRFTAQAGCIGAVLISDGKGIWHWSREGLAGFLRLARRNGAAIRRVEAI